jgi:uncharacterized protein YcbK (DUF882 family)
MMPVGRRNFLIGSMGAVGWVGLTPLRSAWATPAAEAQTLSLYNIHTAETLKTTYREHGDLLPEALAEIKHFLRDFRNEQTHDIDVALLDVLHDLHAAYGQRGRFEVISGYRSPATNAALRHVTTGVAEHSLHLSGKAIDVRLTSAATKDLRTTAIGLRRGGVGYYPESNFVHVDTGPFRSW